MNILDVFTSRFVVTEDLKGIPHDVTITKLESQKLGENEEPKLIVHTREFKKPFVMGIMNARTIVRLHGSDSAEIVGKRITIYPSEWMMDGVPTPCMKVKPKAPPEATATKSPARKKKPRL